MAYKLIWAPSARLDLKEISSYITETHPEVSRKFVQSVFQTVEPLSQFPESGRVVPEFGDPTIREVIRKPCRIVYRLKVADKVVEIARIWHAARGIPQL